MKILTWNINGIRAVTGKTGVKKMLDSLDADVVCLQETKVTRDMLDEPTAIVDGYESFFSFSRKRTGYSGTANYCRKRSTPVRAEEGLTGRQQIDEETGVGCYGNTDAYSEKELEALDAEGRCVITQHRLRLANGEEKEVALINVYVPRAGDRPERLEYKLRFLSLLQSRAQALLKEDVHVIILGDLNLTHTAKDNCDPKSDADFLRRSSRVWINNMLRRCERDSDIPSSHPDLDAVALSGVTEDESQSDDDDESTTQGNKKKANLTRVSDNSLETAEAFLFSDVYRHLHPDETNGYTNWDTSTDARKSNYGRRLDYILVDTGLASHVTDCCILTEVEGSDHCPVAVTLDCQPVPCTSASPPQLCSKLMPEFRGQQQKLSSFFIKTVVSKSAKADSVSSSQSSVSPSQEDKEVVIVDETPAPLTKSSSIPSRTTSSSSPAKLGLKRGKSCNSGSSSQGAPSSKKLKQAGPKQASLTAFFGLKTNNSVNRDSSKPAQSCLSFIKTKSIHPEEDSSNKDQNSLNSCSRNQNLVNSKFLCANSQDKSQDKDISYIADVAVEELSGDKNSVLNKSVQEGKPNLSSSQSWKSLLCGPAPAPLCPGHKEPCVLKTVRKNGPNKNKQFYSCPRPDGPPGNPQFRCNFFQWLSDRKKKTTG